MRTMIDIIGVILKELDVFNLNVYLAMKIVKYLRGDNNFIYIYKVHVT